MRVSSSLCGSLDEDRVSNWPVNWGKLADGHSYNYAKEPMLVRHKLYTRHYTSSPYRSSFGFIEVS